jgi:predicted nucleic acid-binding protein
VLVDVVLDTNVLLHADDERQDHQADARGLLDDLLVNETALCVDAGFDTDTAKNRSLIGGEYLENLNPTHTAMAVIAHLFATDRVRFVSRSVPPAVKKCVEQCVRKKRDRTFLLVAYNSHERVLCSHDYEDMQAKKRQHLKKVAKVDVLQGADVRPLL